jgi:hypothetical protein
MGWNKYLKTAVVISPPKPRTSDTATQGYEGIARFAMSPRVAFWDFEGG